MSHKALLSFNFSLGKILLEFNVKINSKEHKNETDRYEGSNEHSQQGEFESNHSNLRQTSARYEQRAVGNAEYNDFENNGANSPKESQRDRGQIEYKEITAYTNKNNDAKYALDARRVQKGLSQEQAINREAELSFGVSKEFAEATRGIQENETNKTKGRINLETNFNELENNIIISNKKLEFNGADLDFKDNNFSTIADKITELWLSTKDEQFNIDFSKTINDYSKFSEKIRFKDMQGKIEEKSNAIANNHLKLNETEKDKMLNDFSLAHKTNSINNISFNSINVISNILQEKIKILKQNNSDLDELSLNLNKNINNFKNTLDKNLSNEEQKYRRRLRK